EPDASTSTPHHATATALSPPCCRHARGLDCLNWSYFSPVFVLDSRLHVAQPRVMKTLSTFSILSILVGVTAALAQDAPSAPQRGQNRGAGRSDPHIVAPRATPGLHPPDAPALPYHFVAQPAPMPGQ